MEEHDEAPLSLVLVNAPPGDADRIARSIVEARLAACVNVIPAVRSFYVWEGRMTEDAEATLLIKTRTSLVDALTSEVRAIHPYSVPEVIAVPLSDQGNPAYLAWVRKETSDPAPTSRSSYTGPAPSGAGISPAAITNPPIRDIVEGDVIHAGPLSEGNVIVPDASAENAPADSSAEDDSAEDDTKRDSDG